MSDRDFSELEDLASDLTSVIQATVPRVGGSAPFLRQAVEHSAHLLKEGWTREAKKESGKRLKAYPYSIDYEVEPASDSGVSAVVGPNQTRAQGVFGAAEDAPDGWRRLGARPQHASKNPALKAEKDLRRGVRIAIDDALRKANL